MGTHDIDRPLKMGEIRSVRSNGGTTLNMLELLFSPTTIAKFEVIVKMLYSTGLRISEALSIEIDNVDLKYQDLRCSLSKDVLRDLYIYIRDLYNELNDKESEENK